LAKPGPVAGAATTGQGVDAERLADASAGSGAAGEQAVHIPQAPMDDAAAQRLVDARIAARKAKNFAESDRIRDELAAAGVIVEDKPGGKSTWRRA
jgi:cysteinyl-tRNA synthetase